jgi:hypothetical protein
MSFSAHVARELMVEGVKDTGVLITLKSSRVS